MAADPVTTFLGLTKPIVNDEEGEDLWGEKLNTNFDIIDTFAAAQGVLIEAPDDGAIYGRQSATWTPVPSKADFDAAVAAAIPEAPADGYTYGRRGSDASWQLTTGGATLSDTPPASPLNGQFWLETDTGALFVRWNDADSAQWVQVNASVSTGGGGDYLPLTGGTLSGPLFITTTQANIYLESTNSASSATIRYVRGGLANWMMLQGGSGSLYDWQLQRYNAGGTYVDSPIRASFVDGLVTVTGLVTTGQVTAGAIVNNGNYSSSVAGAAITLDNTSPSTHSAGFNYQRNGTNNWIIQHSGSANDLNFLRRNTTTGGVLDTPLALKSDGTVAVGSAGISSGGDLWITKSAAYIGLNNTDAAQTSGMYWQRSGTNNWIMMQGGTATANDWILQRYNAGGTYQDNPIRVAFATGNVSMADALSVGGTLTATGQVQGGASNLRWSNAGGTIFVDVGVTSGYGLNLIGAPTNAIFIQHDGNLRYRFSSADFSPLDNVVSCGQASRRWTQLFAMTATIGTSDENEKQDIRPLNEVELAVARRLKGLIVAYKWKDAVASKSADGARIHIGIIAQRVQEAFAAEGLDAHAYGMFCEDELTRTVMSTFDEDGNELTPEREEPTGEVRYGVRYTEVIMFILGAM